MAAGCVIVIPARYRSSRFPGKVLAPLQGRPMIEHVVRRASRARGIDEVMVATDDERIRGAVEAFGGKAVMTSPEHRCGTDRVAELARGLAAGTEIVVNLQGDEPLIDPRAIEAVIEPLRTDTGLPAATLMKRITDEGELHDPNVVKVVVDREGFALYFSRACIPHLRKPGSGEVYKHVGLYAYRRRFLLELASLEQTPLEKAESLEQLRILEHGHRLKVVETDFRSLNVDTPEHLARAAALLED